MSRFEVSPAELEGAAGTLGAVEAGFGCPSRAIGELGSPELEGAINVFFQTADELALAMARAVGQASINRGRLDSFSKDSMDSVVGARDAAARLLARELSDEDLAAELDRAGLEYAPDYEGMTHREWLELVVDRLTARLGSASEASDMETIGFIPMWRRIRQTGEVRPDPNGSSPRFECFTRSKRSVNRRDRRDRGLARPNAHLVRALRPRA